MAAMIYAPTVAILTMGNLDAKWFWPIVLITGLSNTIYTVVSGVRGVIVTEALHIPVIIFGVGATIAAAWWQLPVPLSTALGDLASSGRLDVFNFSIDPRTPHTIWTVILGVSVGNLTNYIGDQMSLQRYLVTGDVRSASRSFAVNVIGVVIVVVLLTLVGLSMHVYYSHTTDPTLPAKADEVFPHFVATRLPVGVAGLLLAALLASTGVPSGINALAAVLTLDIHARLRTGMTAAQQVWWGRFYSLMIGLLATLTAGVVSKLGTLFELSQRILGLFAGPLLSCVVVAVGRVALHRRSDGRRDAPRLAGGRRRDLVGGRRPLGRALLGPHDSRHRARPLALPALGANTRGFRRDRKSIRPPRPERSAPRAATRATLPPAPFAGPLPRHIGFDPHRALTIRAGRGRSGRQNGMP